MMKTCLVVFFLAVFSGVWARRKQMSYCEIANDLYQHGIREDLENWVCLVLSESGGRKDVIGPQNSDGSYDYGLFQINSKYWCGIGHVGGECNIPCEAFLDGDITDDVACARKIFSRHGFSAWYGWKKLCTKGKPLPNLSNC